ncbi:cytosine permease [Shouchella clausii]|uniref:cytosine permease n=1 Tax=Shouchella clausii TaxID=79880 RepID=UPI000BA65B7A|nr:cytosine permease [Shouchella clausii]PAD16841.1 cytosine permease [Shouchella clausii]
MEGKYVAGKIVESDFEWQAVPQGRRRGFWQMFVLMVGFTFFSASMLAGGTLGQGLSFSRFLITVLVGNFILGVYTGALAYIAAKTGLSTHLLTRFAFGEKGSYLPSLLLSVTQIGWFGVGLMMLAVPVQKVTGVDLWLLLLLGGVLMTATAYLGVKALTMLSFVAVPAIAVLGTISSSIAVNDMGGPAQLFAYQPTEGIGIAAALSVCIGSFISGGTLTPDFARYGSSKKVAVSTTVIAFFLGNSLMFLFGAVGAISTGFAEISEVMFTQGLIWPAIFALGLNIWTTNDSALYASGLGLSNVTKFSKKKLVLVNGLVGTLLANWLYTNFVSWLDFLNLTLPPIGAIVLVDYFIIKKGTYAPFKQASFKAVRANALIAWLIGLAGALFVPGIQPLNALIFAALSYICLEKIVNRKGEQL